MNSRVDLSMLVQPPDAPQPSSKVLPAYEPFTWTVPEAEKASTLEQVKRICEARDIAYGASDIMAILERMEIDKGCENTDGSPIAPILDAVVAGNLQRLAITSLRMLRDRLDESIQAANRQAALERGAG